MAVGFCRLLHSQKTNKEADFIILGVVPHAWLCKTTSLIQSPSIIQSTSVNHSLDLRQSLTQPLSITHSTSANHSINSANHTLNLCQSLTQPLSIILNLHNSLNTSHSLNLHLLRNLSHHALQAVSLVWVCVLNKTERQRTGSTVTL